MARSLQKVTKKISKKRTHKPTSLHENSRDAQRLRRAGARDDKLSRMMDAATRANQSYVDRVAWFKSALEGSTGPLSEEEMSLLTQSFIAREDDELAEIQAVRREGRPASKAEERIIDRKNDETKEYKAGFWLPDLRDEESRAKIERWGGQWSGLNSLNFVRIVKDGAIKASKFPPKALS